MEARTDRKSLKGLSAEKELRKKEAEAAAQQLGKTEVDVVKVADQVGAIDSGLTDINERIREARNRVLDSAGKAGDQDKAKIEEKEKAARDQRTAVDAVECRTAAERRRPTKFDLPIPGLWVGPSYRKSFKTPASLWLKLDKNSNGGGDPPRASAQLAGADQAPQEGTWTVSSGGQVL